MPVDVWLPSGFHVAKWPTTPIRGGKVGDVITRIKSASTLADVQHEFDRINSDFISTYPAEYGGIGTGWKISVRPLQSVMIGDSGKPLLLLLGAVAFVLLVACTNVASLLLARGAAKRTEIAVRAAIGAGRGRILQGLLTEHSARGTDLGLLLPLVPREPEHRGESGSDHEERRGLGRD